MSENTQKLLKRLNGMSAFKPMTVATFADWSLDAGDVITVHDAESNEDLLMPLFHNDLSWDGAARGDLSCTGEEKRPVEKQGDRDEQRFRKSTNKKLNSLDSSVGSLGSSVSSLKKSLSTDELTSMTVIVDVRRNANRWGFWARKIKVYGSYAGDEYEEEYISI